MSITVEAIYENGVLRPTKMLPLKEHEKVTITVQAAPQVNVPTADEAESAVRRSYGLIGWAGDVETLRRVAEDAEYSLRRP